jgi:hypothetical protein
MFVEVFQVDWVELSLRNAATNGSIVQPPYEYGASVEWYWQGKTKEPVPEPRCPPENPHGLTRERTRASTGRGWRLTAWAIKARPDTIRNFCVGILKTIFWLQFKLLNHSRKSHSVPLTKTGYLLFRPYCCMQWYEQLGGNLINHNLQMETSAPVP